MKYEKTELCEKIRQVFPDVGECGIDIKMIIYYRDRE